MKNYKGILKKAGGDKKICTWKKESLPPAMELWRWADSNRRPNTVQECFLHAYFTFVCRERLADERAGRTLSSETWPAIEESAGASGLNDTPIPVHDRPEERRDIRLHRILGGTD